MSATCQHCGRKSQLFLCRQHTDELREMLLGLPQLLDWLEDAAIGQVKLSDDGDRRGRRSVEWVDGDTPLDVYRRMSRAESSALLRRFLALGGINAKAAELGQQVRLMLVRWAQDVCDSRGLTYPGTASLGTGALPPQRDGEPRTVPPSGGYTGEHVSIALWLAEHSSALAADESAGMCFGEVQHAIERILTVINPPVPPLFVGPCPAPHPDEDRKACATRLIAKRDAIEVRCPQCKATHHIETLMNRQINALGHQRFTVQEIHLIMTKMGTPLPERTFRDWRKKGKILVAGYRRPDGRLAFTRHSDDDEPVYRLADVRKLKGERESVTA